mgnify:CR=1 FL=1
MNKLKYFLFSIILISAWPSFSQENIKPVKKEAVRSTMELRTELLNSKSAKYNLKPSSKSEPWAVIMDLGFPDGGSFSIVGLSDGNGSIYLSSGGGVIGGISHNNVVIAAKNLVKYSEQYLPLTTKVDNYPLPKSNIVDFYIISDNGVHLAKGNVNNISSEKHELYGMFYLANNLMTQLRTVAQQ